MTGAGVVLDPSSPRRSSAATEPSRSRRGLPPRDAAAERARIWRRVADLAPHYIGGAVPTAHLVDWMRGEGWSRDMQQYDLRILVRAGVLERIGTPWGPEGTAYRVRP